MANDETRNSAKRKHKRIQKKRFSVKRGAYGNPKMTEAKCRNDEWYVRQCPRNGGYAYWQDFYLSGARRFAKQCTNRKIRAYYRDLINSGAMDDLDEIVALHGSNYEKMFDYMWTIW